MGSIGFDQNEFGRVSSISILNFSIVCFMAYLRAGRTNSSSEFYTYNRLAEFAALISASYAFLSAFLSWWRLVCSLKRSIRRSSRTFLNTCLYYRACSASKPKSMLILYHLRFSCCICLFVGSGITLLMKFFQSSPLLSKSNRAKSHYLSNCSKACSELFSPFILSWYVSLFKTSITDGRRNLSTYLFL